MKFRHIRGVLDTISDLDKEKQVTAFKNFFKKVGNNNALILNYANAFYETDEHKLLILWLWLESLDISLESKPKFSRTIKKKLNTYSRIKVYVIYYLLMKAGEDYVTDLFGEKNYLVKRAKDMVKKLPQADEAVLQQLPGFPLQTKALTCGL